MGRGRQGTEPEPNQNPVTCVSASSHIRTLTNIYIQISDHLFTSLATEECEVFLLNNNNNNNFLNLPRE